MNETEKKKSMGELPDGGRQLRGTILRTDFVRAGSAGDAPESHLDNRHYLDSVRSGGFVDVRRAFGPPKTE